MDDSVGNPYDFANPVADPAVFAGRKAETQTIKYYLDEAKRATRPFNLAVIGPRGSGKTSIINMIASEAAQRKYLVVRVSLDEGHAVSPLAFFFKIIDSIIYALVDEGCWGGTRGATYEHYLSLVTTNEIPTNEAYRTFLFPIQYASAMSAHNQDAPVSDQLVEHDLRYMSEAAARPIVLLLDECNVLSSHRILLEKLRNLFMNMPGYMLCLAGTDDLFPMINDVFSPIARQFKKIHVAEFTDFGETRDCIELPLKQKGLMTTLPSGQDRRLFEKEIHELTGGRPYEIQLVCHKCFSRLQQQEEREQMVLDAGVLEDVRDELETAQDMSKRTVLGHLDRLSPRHLLALDAMGQCAPSALIDRLWQTEQLFHGNGRFTEDTFLASLEDLVAWGILSREGTLVSFAGDDFDRIYLKYYALERGLKIQVRSLRPDLFFSRRLGDFLRAIPGAYVAGYFSVQSGHPISLSSTAAAMSQQHAARNPLDGLPYALDLYQTMLTTYYEEDAIDAIRVTITSPWATADACVFAEMPSDTRALAAILQAIKELESRSQAAETSVSVESCRVAVLPPEELRPLAETVRRANVRARLGLFHFNEAIDCYLEADASTVKPRVQTWFHAGIVTALQLDWPRDLQLALAYMVSTGPDLQSAEKLLTQFTEQYSQTPHSAVALYDLSVVAAKRGEIQHATALLSQAENRWQMYSGTKDLGPWTLQLISVEQGEVLGKEADSTELPDAITKARDVLSGMQ